MAGVVLRSWPCELSTARRRQSADSHSALMALGQTKIVLGYSANSPSRLFWALLPLQQFCPSLREPRACFRWVASRFVLEFDVQSPET